jgi:hypothetical protein
VPRAGRASDAFARRWLVASVSSVSARAVFRDNRMRRFDLAMAITTIVGLSPPRARLPGADTPSSASFKMVAGDAGLARRGDALSLEADRAVAPRRSEACDTGGVGGIWVANGQAWCDASQTFERLAGLLHDGRHLLYAAMAACDGCCLEGEVHLRVSGSNQGWR